MNYAKETNSDIIFLHVHINSSYKITLRLELLGYCQTNASIHPTEERAFRVNNILKLLHICQSTVLNEEFSSIDITNDT